jgi:transposase
MTRVAEVVDAVIGGDTHSLVHQLELAAPTGAVLAITTVSNDEAGFRSALAWIAEHCPGGRVMVGLEGTRSYGVGLARALAAAGLTVVEVEQPSAKSRRGKGKSDPIDAHHAALSLLAMDTGRLPTPRADGDREALRILLGAHREITTTRVRHGNELRALLLTGSDEDRALAAGVFTLGRLDRIARRRDRAGATREQAVRRAEARRLALACRQAYYELKAHRAHLVELINALAPGMLTQAGVGPISAAQILISFSHPGRCRNDAAFAKLAGVAPIPATSGKTVNRHRINYGGDRQLNRALHDIAKWRILHCEQTQAYVARRTAEGKTLKEIRRCLKRYLARQQHRFLTTAMA